MKQKNNKESNQSTPKVGLSSNNPIFWKFIIEKQQLVDWIVCFLTCLAGYLWIRHCYPYPATFPDSFSYVAAAADNQFYVFRPFGYSAFLRFLHPISQSMVLVTISQFLLYFLSISLLVLALKKYYPLKAPVRIPFAILIAFFPVAIYMCNALMSDALFCCTSLMMITMLLVLFNETRLNWVSAVLYLIVFHFSLYLRYSAMFYPIAVIPFLFLVKPQWLKWSVIVMTGIVFAIFHRNISDNMYESVRLHQFSTGFDGWQLANNGLHVLPYIDDTDIPDNKKVANLHNFCKDDRFDSLILVATQNGTEVTSAFLWDKELPLKQYLFYYMQEKRTFYPIAWAKLGGGLYSDYGKWLILHHPGLFFKYYLSKNITYGFYPKTLEMVGHYTEIPTGDKDICRWFDVKDNESFACRNQAFEKMPAHLLSIWELIDWIFMLVAVAVLFIFRKTSFSNREKIMSFGLILAFGFLYYGTTIFASPIAIRYWMPMHALKWAIVWIALSEVSQRLNQQKQ